MEGRSFPFMSRRGAVIDRSTAKPGGATMRVRTPQLAGIRVTILTLSVSAAGGAVSAAAPQLPVPCVAGSCGPAGPSQFVTGGAATAVGTQNALKINQTTSSAILNWSSFNVGAGKAVAFNQPSSSAIALNRIFQASPSSILGQLTANGQVYLINLNGVIFGKTAQVNVGSLLVSSLPLALTDSNFSNGILAPLQNGKAVLDATLDPAAPGVGRSVVLDAQGNPVLDSQGKPIPVQVVVEPGAELTAGSKGRLLLAGQSVTNGGSLTAPDGQVVLAAGSKVYLQADSDPSLRGLVVEVDQGGTAWNQLSGSISAPRGNVTLVGLAVNQEGRISATTSVSANGSIRLEAADTAQFASSGGNVTVASSHGGTLTLGAHSDLEILPELTSTASEVPAQAQLESSVTLLGEQVFMKGGSIVAPGGNLTAIAAANPSPAAANPKAGVGAADPNARLRVDPGVSIDLSGSEASLPVSANLVPVQLRSSELADDPTQRNGPLHGLTVYVDARNPPLPQFANVSGDIAAVPQSVAQRTENGGNAVLQSGGDLVFSNGASLNISGGSTSYSGGVMQTSYLIGANGKLYPIATADPLLSYVGVLNPTFSQAYNTWGVKDIIPIPGLSTSQQGYVQGAPAGSVQFAAPAMVLQGTLQGSAINGLYQRTPSTAVSGGQLVIGLPGGVGTSGSNPPIDFLSPAIQFARTNFPIVTSDDSALPQPLTLYLPVSYLTSSGLTSTRIYSNYDVTLPAGAPLTLPSGSTLAVEAARINVLAGITDAGGTLSFENVFNLGSAGTPPLRPGVFVGDDVSLDVSGQWTNDAPTVNGSALTQTWQNGGQINLGVSTPGAMLSLGNRDALRANGGAWLKANDSLVAGTGGSITLSSNAFNSGLDVGDQLAISGFGVQGASGGSFTLAAPRVEVRAGSGGWTEAQQVDDTVKPGKFFQLFPALFSDYGFQSIDINASGLVASGAPNANVLSIDPGTAINATVGTLSVQPSHIFLSPSAPTIEGLVAVTTLAPYQRAGASVILSALPPPNGPAVQLGATPAGNVTIGPQASITTDAGGSINLVSLNSIMVGGELRAPGGRVSLQIVSPSANNNAYASYEAGFLPNQSIDLGPTGVIDVSGTFVPTPSQLPLDLGTLYPGGTVTLFADRGAVVAERGSLISVAGASAPIDILQPSQAYGHEVAASAGGSLAVRSGQAVLLLGSLHAAGGTTGTSGPAAAGSLDVELTRSESWWGVTGSPENNNSFNQGPLTVELLPQAPLIVGLPTPWFGSNLAMLGAADLSQSGIDALRIEAGNDLMMSGNFSLGLSRSITFNSPVIAAAPGTRASVSAPYLEVGYALTTGTSTNSSQATPGSGVVHFTGSEIDLVGTTVFQGISTVGMSSSGDLLLRGQPLGSGASTLLGGVTVDGALTLDAARIYPATATSFSIDAEEPASGVASSITIAQTSPSPGTPLSAGGALAITADNITTAGSIYAPFGSISLKANDSLTLNDNSVTSVSGNGLTIPYGQTQFGGTQWLYAAFSGDQTVSTVPARAVSLSAPSATLTKQATVDLSGGGDLLAFEWVPGSGGTTDALAPGVVPGLYAILPSTRGQAAPQDPQSFAGAGLAPGASIYLSGGPGLTAGTYPLLPARYALTPGALLVQAVPNVQSTTPGLLETLPNGFPVIAGFLSYGSTGLHQSPGYSGFAIYPGSYGQQLAQYDLSVASTYFSAAASSAGKPRPTLPADAGLLSIAVTSSLDIAGQVRTAAASGGLPATVEISANDLVIGNPTGPVPADAVSIPGSVLASWKPGSLLLGGTTSTDGDTINVLASSITVGSGTKLIADEIVLVADQLIDVQAGATLLTTSAAQGAALPALPVPKPVRLATSDGGGAGILAVSDRNWLIPASGTSAATVTVDSGASLGSRGSLSLDAAGGVRLDGTLDAPGAEWSLGSSSIAFVPSGSHADSLSIGPGLLSQLEGASAVRLASTGSIDLLTPVALGVDSHGSATLNSLTLVAASLNNQAGAGTTQFGARTLTLAGAGSSVTPGAAGAAGANLALTASELDIGPDPITVNGFASTSASISGAAIGQGTGGLSVGGDLSLSAAGVTAAAGAQTSIGASGALTVAAAKGNAGKLPTFLGGALTLSGGTLDVSGAVSAPSGIVSLVSGGRLNIGSGATVSAGGRVVSVGDQSIDTPGGEIDIRAGGDLTVGPKVVLDVSGAGTAAGGDLSVNAAGAVSLGGDLKGGGGKGANGGSFSLDAGSLTQAPGSANPLTALASSLAGGGFQDALDLRVRTGDISLDPGSVLSAQSVLLSADSGHLAIAGTISAPSDAHRGAITIFGGNGVELESGGVLRADGAGPAGSGGTIEIGAGQLLTGPGGVLDTYNNGSIRLDPGSTISAAGAAGSGTLLLRAPALLASNDVAIGSLGSDTHAVGQIVVEPVLPFNTTAFSNATAPSAGDLQQVYQTVAGYMASAGPGIAARLQPTSGTPLHVVPGVELLAPGTLTLQSADSSSPALDLSTWRFDGAPVDFTVRAVGDITVANTLTDGFATALAGSQMQPTLLNGASSSIRLIAGADLSSANPLASVTGSGTLTIGSGAVVRTGTGDIDLIAGRDIVIGGPGAGAYTAGVPTVAPGGTETNPYSAVPAEVGTALPNGVLIPGTSLLMSFPTGGGNLVVNAGEDILGVPVTNPGVSSWQLREGGGTFTPAGQTSPQTVLPMWGVNLAAYNWNFGTLGGGDLSLTAGRDALNVTAAAADSLLPQYGGTTQYVRGGGLSFSSGRDIGSAEVFLADGNGSVVARGALTAVLPAQNPGDPNIGSAFFLQSSTIDVTSRLGMAVDGVFNPTALGQLSTVKLLTGKSYFSYDADSSLALQAISGDVVLGANPDAAPAVLGRAVNNAVGVGKGALPASLSVAAPGGGISFGAGIGFNGFITLYPSPHGQLDLLAAHDITGILGQTGLTMSDAQAGSYASVSSPNGLTTIGGAAFSGNIHTGDATAALVTAAGQIDALTLSIPKPSHVVAGTDIVDVAYTGQNLNNTDQTVFMAGRDLVYSEGNSGNAISVGGPGDLTIFAGRTVSLGFSQGIVTTGNLLNPNLPTAQGANLTIATGRGTPADTGGFLQSIIAPSSTYQADLVDYVESLQGSTGLSFEAASHAFLSLPPEQQQPLIDDVFFNELLRSGRAANSSGGSFAQGYAAIDALFPASRTGSAGAKPGSYGGDLTLAFSRIYTLSGGNIELLVPGGLVDVGLANPPPLLSSRAPSTLGIVAEGQGNVEIYSKGDVNVNASRVFTLGGGNILIWSDEGSIDAGRGAKSAVSAPPPAVLINSNGTVTLDFSGAAAGSGIRTIQTSDTVPLGDVDLIAPVGTVNAGDAGIGSAGNINIAARSVIGVSNINFGGTATGVPSEVGNLGAALSAASSVGSGATTAATAAVGESQGTQQSAAPLSQTALGWLEVFVTGLGEANCKPEDQECLKQQASGAH
jgi:filamentous hemagglutinin family protein